MPVLEIPKRSYSSSENDNPMARSASGSPVLLSPPPPQFLFGPPLIEHVEDESLAHSSSSFAHDYTMQKAPLSQNFVPSTRLTRAGHSPDSNGMASSSRNSSPLASEQDYHVDDTGFLVASPPKLGRSPSVGGSWGIRGVGRGFDLSWSGEHSDDTDDEEPTPGSSAEALKLKVNTDLNSRSSYTDYSHSDTSPHDKGLGIHSLTEEPGGMRIERSSPLSRSPSPLIRAALMHAFPTSNASNFPPRTQSSPALNVFSTSPRASSLPHRHPFPGSFSPSTPGSRSPSISSGFSSLRSSRQRDTQKRISLVAGRIVPVPPLLHPPYRAPSRWPSSTNVKPDSEVSSPKTESGSDASSTSSGSTEAKHRVDDFIIDGEAGRGAYGLVKRVRERKADGSFGHPLIMKQVIKSRILADCWKKHPTHGTIPIEIHVMSALSASEYILPERRPWDPLRFEPTPLDSDPVGVIEEEEGSTSSTPPSPRVPPGASNLTTVLANSPPPMSGSVQLDGPPQVLHAPIDPAIERHWSWRRGALHKGHPSIVPLLEFFEDREYYYLILPAATPSIPSSLLVDSRYPFEPSPLAGTKCPSDLFDLVERFPRGLPAPLVRTFLGQLADALAFLHKRGICHRDIKDENVVLAEDGRIWLIDFGSSGVVKKDGWDTFSGTLDYAGPEILRGERYAGPPQDVWAFGIVSYVLITGECPFSTAADADVGLAPNSRALLNLEDRCGASPPSDSQEPESPSASLSNLSLSPTSFMSAFGAPNPLSAEELERRANEGLESDEGGRMGDVMALIKACLNTEPSKRPSFDDVLAHKFLKGRGGWVESDEL